MALLPTCFQIYVGSDGTLSYFKEFQLQKWSEAKNLPFYEQCKNIFDLSVFIKVAQVVKMFTEYYHDNFCTKRISWDVLAFV